MRWAVWFWVGVVLLRMGYAWLAPQIDPFLRHDPLHGDAQVHDQMAWTLVQEGRLQFVKGLQTAPAYIWLMAGVYGVVGHEPQAVRIVNALLGVLALWGLWRVAVRWLGRRYAFVVVALATIHPHLLMLSGWLYTENLMVPLVVWAIERASATRTVRNGVIVGVMLGLRVLTRANFLPFAGLVGLWWLFVTPASSGGASRFLSAGVLLAITCLTVAPYILYLYGRYGHFIPIGLGGYTFLWANNPEADGGFRADFTELRMVIDGQKVRVRDWLTAPNPVERDRKALRLALTWIRENPTDFLHLLWLKTRLSLSAFGLQEAGNRLLVRLLRFADGLYWLYLLLAHWGLFVGWRSHWRQWGLVALLEGWVWLTIWLYAGGSRPLLPIQPFWVLFFVHGVQRALRRASTSAQQQDVARLDDDID